MQIKVQTPAKINLVLEVLGKREDGFHEIQSIMQAVSLYDFLTIDVEDNKTEIVDVLSAGTRAESSTISTNIITDENKNLNPSENIIELNGNSDQIPYDNKNLVYKAAEKFLDKANINGKKIKIYIEKNIPVAAGLAGGSSNAAGTLWGLNQIFENILSNSELHELAAQMGSDLNFCLEGGTQVATSRGEVLSPISTPDFKVVIIKPKNLFISAKEAYEKWDAIVLKGRTVILSDQARRWERENLSGVDILIDSHVSPTGFLRMTEVLKNNLEDAILQDYPEIQEIKDYLMKKGCENTLMSGSGPSVFGIYENDIDLSDAKPDWECFKVKTINSGVSPTH